MRCLLVSDLHYSLKQFDWVLNNAEAYDVVVIAGDHIDISSTVELRAQVTVILTYLKRLSAKTQIVVCSGNHDLDAIDMADEKYTKWILRVRQFGVSTDDDRLVKNDTLFTVCPWWDGPKSCDKVARQLEHDSRIPKKQWIWVYHSPPDESPTSWAGRKYFGDSQLVKWIQRYSPDMVLTGHIHYAPFKEGGSWVDRIGRTWIFNSGRQMSPCPTHIILDSEEQMALWFSLAGAEVVALDQPLMRPVPSLMEWPAWLK